MRAVVVVERLPFGQAFIEIRVAFVAQELIELLLVGAVRSLDLPVQLRGPGFDVDVADAVVGQMPVEERLELMATVRADGVNPKRELLNHRVYEGDGVLLRVAAVDAQGPDAGGVVDGY